MGSSTECYRDVKLILHLVGFRCSLVGSTSPGTSWCQTSLTNQDRVSVAITSSETDRNQNQWNYGWTFMQVRLVQITRWLKVLSLVLRWTEGGILTEKKPHTQESSRTFHKTQQPEAFVTNESCLHSMDRPQHGLMNIYEYEYFFQRLTQLSV